MDMAAEGFEDDSNSNPDVNDMIDADQKHGHIDGHEQISVEECDSDTYSKPHETIS